jgi:WD40 repeat protein
MLIILSACATTEMRPTDTHTKESPNQITPSVEIESPTETRTPTITCEPTMTATPEEFHLADWKEPMEIIGPDNIDKVEKIGELVFENSINRFLWSPDGLRFGVSSNGHVSVMESQTFSHQLKVGGSYIAFSYDGKIVETDQYRYYLETGEEMKTGYLNQYPGGVLDIEFSPNGEYLASSGTQFIQIYPLSENIQLAQFGRYAWSSYHVSVSMDSKLIAVNSAEETFTELWDPYQQKPVRILKLKGINGQGKPRFSKDGVSLFFTGTGFWDEQESSFLQEWDYRMGKPLDVQLLPEIVMDYVSPIDLSPTSSVVAFGTHEGNIYVMPLRNCGAIQINDINQSRDPVDMVAIRPDGKVIATTGISNRIIDLWGIPSSNVDKPTVEITETPAACPIIPMEVEYPTPKYDWWGGDKPHL